MLPTIMSDELGNIRGVGGGAVDQLRPVWFVRLDLIASGLALFGEGG